MPIPCYIKGQHDAQLKPLNSNYINNVAKISNTYIVAYNCVPYCGIEYYEIDIQSQETTDV